MLARPVISMRFKMSQVFFINRISFNGILVLQEYWTYKALELLSILISFLQPNVFETPFLTLIT
jgi:hypothetical protein